MPFEHALHAIFAGGFSSFFRRCMLVALRMWTPEQVGQRGQREEGTRRRSAAGSRETASAERKAEDELRANAGQKHVRGGFERGRDRGRVQKRDEDDVG